MIWRVSPSYPDYEVSDQGQVRRIGYENPRKTHLDMGGISEGHFFDPPRAEADIRSSPSG